MLHFKTVYDEKKKKKYISRSMKKSCYSSRAKYLHSFTISVRDESMWQSQTHERVGQVSFFVVLSLFSFLVFSVFLLLSLSPFFNSILTQATNDNARSTYFDWSHIVDTHFSFSSCMTFSLPLSLCFGLSVCMLVLFAFDNRSKIEKVRSSFLLDSSSFSCIVLISGIFERLLLLLLVMT